jgi:AcrR family transcriptional regulator
VYLLNVFNFEVKSAKGDATRGRVMETALRLFRKHGFERTTMREVAKAARLSLGAAYHYFPSKDALVMAYYQRLQEEHEREIEEALPRCTSLRERFGLIIHTKVGQAAGERELSNALVRLVVDPRSPLSVFAPETAEVRARSVAIFERAFADEPLPDDLKALMAPASWLIMLAFMYYAVLDRSEGVAKTHRLIDEALDMLVPLLGMLALPPFEPLRVRLGQLMKELLEVRS